MNILYKPVLIESAEQAEALPAMALCLGEGTWCRRHDPAEYRPSLPFRALVPIEAEEEWAAEFESGEMYVNLDEETARAADGGTAMSRLATPWEEA